MIKNQVKRTAKNYTLRIDGKKYETSSYLRFCNHIRTIKWQHKPLVYLRVYYGIFKDVTGKKQGFYNDGEYDNRKDFMMAFEAFSEDREK